MITVNVGRRLIQIVIKKSQDGLRCSRGEDNRRKNIWNKISDVDLNFVRAHIVSFPTLESH